MAEKELTEEEMCRVTQDYIDSLVRDFDGGAQILSFVMKALTRRKSERHLRADAALVLNTIGGLRKILEELERIANDALAFPPAEKIEQS